MRWMIFGEMSTDIDGEEDRHECGLSFLLHKDMDSALPWVVDQSQ